MLNFSETNNAQIDFVAFVCLSAKAQKAVCDDRVSYNQYIEHFLPSQVQTRSLSWKGSRLLSFKRQIEKLMDKIPIADELMKFERKISAHGG